MNIQITLFHNKVFEEPVATVMDSECTIVELKEMCLKKQDKLTKLYNIGLVHRDKRNVVSFLNNDKEKLNQYIESNSIIYIFRINDILLLSAYLYEQIPITPITVAAKKKKTITSQQYIKISYNQLQNEPTTSIEYTQIIVVPNTLTMGDLRAILSHKLGVHIDECVLRKKWHDVEFKNNKKLLKNSGIHSGIIHVEKGKPLKVDQYLFQIFVAMEYNKKELLVFGYITRIALKFKHNQNPLMHMVPTSIKNLCFAFFYEKELNEQLDYIGDMVLNKNMLIQDIKHRIYDQYKLYVPHPSFMRIRDFIREWNKYKMCDQYVLRDVYYDNFTLHQLLKSRIKDFQQIAIQRMEYIEKDKLEKKKHLLLNICRYYPAQRQLGNIIEMQFEKQCKITTELRQRLAALTDVSYKNVLVKCFAKPNRLSDIQNLHHLFRQNDSMNYGINDDSTLISDPWKCKNGYCIVFVAKQDQNTNKPKKRKKKTKALSELNKKKEKNCILM